MLLKGEWVCEAGVITLMARAQVQVGNLTHGCVCVSTVPWNATCDLCRRENTTDWGFAEHMWNSDLLHSVLPALYMPEIALRMQSDSGWFHWTCPNMDTGVSWGWNHDIMKYLLVQQERLILCLNLLMQEGVGQVYLCQSFAWASKAWSAQQQQDICAWSGRDTQACILPSVEMEKEKCRKKFCHTEKHDFGKAILRSAALQTSAFPLDLGTGMTRRIMAS